MNLGALRAFVLADLLFRFRRGSTLVLLGVMFATSWLWIPDPATGRALIVIENQRALYTDGTIGMATASLAALFVGLFGFYAVSNAVARDTSSRVGQMLASTPMSKSMYIAGRFLGSAVFLSALLVVFAAGSWAMVFVRGEGRFEPFVFIGQYLLVCTPVVMGVASFAILFEVTPVLRTRAGDVGFFFFWLTLLGVSASAEIAWLDLSGLSWQLEYVKATMGTEEMGIGATTFDTSLPAIEFNGVPFTLDAVLSRSKSIVLPVVLLVPSVLLFHRFDPARVKARATKRSERSSPLAFLTALVEWLPFPRVHGAMGAALLEARLTLLDQPLTVLAIAAAWIAASIGGKGAVAVTIVLAGVSVAGIAARERMAGTSTLIAHSALVGARRGGWKLMSSLIVAAVIALPLLVRLGLDEPSRASRFAAGIVLVSAIANTLGFLTGGSRTFTAILVAAVYVAVDSGSGPAMDFAGFHPLATGAASTWMVIAVLAIPLSLLSSRAGAR